MSEERGQWDMPLQLGIRHSNQSNWKQETPHLAASPFQAVPPCATLSRQLCSLPPKAGWWGWNPSKRTPKSLPRHSISSETALLPQWLKNFDSLGNSLSLMMYKCMTQFCGFWHFNAGNPLKPLLLIPETALDFCPNFFLPPGSHNREFLVRWPLRRDAEILSFHWYSSSFVRVFQSFESSIKLQISMIR